MADISMDGASWHTYQMPFADIPENAETLLIESSASRPQLHALLIYGHIIANARRMKPVFVAEGEARRLLEKIAPKYLGSYKILPPARLGRFNRIYLFMRAFLWWVQIILGRDLLRLHWHGQQIGDIVYDQYLAARQYARLHRWDRQLVRFIYITLRGINEGEATLRTTRAAAVLLAHRVGLPAAAMANAAQKFGLAIFSFGGNRYGTLLQAPVRKSYEYRATQEDLEPILALADGTLNVLFERVRHELLDGAFNADAKLAFSRKLFCDREEFAHMLGLPRGKKNIFIMLHAFTDYPHSHFNGMLFNDYYDWFMQTLKHAFNDKSVNWIIKSHPASRFYPVKDIDWQQIKATWGAEHIAFMSEDADFDTRSIGNVGDAVITCIGSAGFELSAMAGLPSITAGDNPYASSGFAIFPPNREAYFQTLRNIGSLERLKGESLRRAKATFIFIHRLSRVSISAIPTLSHAEQHAYLFNDSYFERVAKDLRGHEEDFDKELRKYMCAVKCPDFRALRTSPADYLRTLYDYSSI